MAGDGLKPPGVLKQNFNTDDMAHKIARSAIACGETILKYGMPIGVATAPIAAGEHVHIHNIRSAYTPSVALQDADGRGAVT